MPFGGNQVSVTQASRGNRCGAAHRYRDAPTAPRQRVGTAAASARSPGAGHRWRWGKIAGVTRADLEKQPHEVAAMFDGVARRYDITNRVLSMGQDAAWRDATVAAVNPQPGHRVLDLAAGTGTSSLPLIQAGADVVAADFSLGMLQVGTVQQPVVPFVAADATKLPFADDSFDAVTISFGLRNVVNYQAGLAEMLRVTKPGGRLVVCEFSRPVWGPWRTVYAEYLMRALPSIARGVSSNPDAYVYLAESIRAWPDQQELATHIADVGWTNVAYRNLTTGIVALHRATAPRM